LTSPQQRRKERIRDLERFLDDNRLVYLNEYGDLTIDSQFNQKVENEARSRYSVTAKKAQEYREEVFINVRQRLEKSGKKTTRSQRTAPPLIIMLCPQLGQETA
jgi:hypothetical protein